ncbi:hypothetical protein RclHR1_13290012 [Rhizophagus clarus]|uniref:Uncharacterized protein n=1 Tax=Rhizophagus clarus TaxID=94130 RepID=A0A2Z6QPL3_9GLOM|nr:hypothetical protein RclHR1_13290012 [Rhizophagus clarus]
MLKWLRNPKHYHINKNYNFEYFIRISDCEKYKANSWSIKSICDLPTLRTYNILGKKLTVNFSDLDDNCEFVCQIFQISS